MRVLIAPDSFKGSLSAEEVTNSIAKGILNVSPEAEIYKLPMADGGEGTIESLVNATNGQIVYKNVTGPLGNTVKGKYGILGDENTAVIEVAAASGLHLVSEADSDAPLQATTYGTGELIKAALDNGVSKLIVGLGGSATIDAGIGMAQALGVSFKDGNNKELAYGGGQLASLNKIDISKLDSRIKNIDIIIASDVNNPLYGVNGAAHVFGPQKGATPEMVEFLDCCLRNYARVIKKDLGKDVDNIPGGGAAGGMGIAFFIFLNAHMRKGIDLILDMNKFDQYLKKVDLVLTGEGKIDSQTLMGKTPYGVAKRAKKYNLPVIAIAGSLDCDALKEVNKYMDAVFSIVQKPATLEEAISNSAEWIESITEQIIRSCALIKI